MSSEHVRQLTRGGRYYRQVLEGQLRILERAKEHCETISHGLPTTAPRRMIKRETPDTPELDQNDETESEFPDETGEIGEF